MRYLFIILAIVFFIFAQSEVAFAQEVVNSAPQFKKPLAKWSFSPAETKLIFEDGREALLVIDVRKKIVIKSKAQFIDDSCYPELLPKDCTWEYEMRSNALSFVWSKNPDITKLGKPLKVESTYNSGNNSEVIVTTTNMGDISFFPFFPEFNPKQVNSPTLICDSDEWTKNMVRNENQEIIIPAWTFEIMTLNAISGKNENQTILQAHNVRLQNIEKKKWQYKLTTITANAENLIPALDPNTIYYQSLDHQQCSIQIRIEKSAVGAVNQMDMQAIEQRYTLPIIKNIPKGMGTSEVIRGAKRLTQQQAYFTVKAE